MSSKWQFEISVDHAIWMLGLGYDGEDGLIVLALGPIHLTWTRT
jgi:hypothetical protein